MYYSTKSHYTGHIPSELGMMTNATVLLLHTNALSGPIPSELGMMANATSLSFSLNPLTGIIPTELAFLTHMGALQLGQSELTGVIPTELGLMTDMYILDLWGAPFTGTIPSELGLLTNMQNFFLSETNLTGQIPTELGMLTAMRELAMNNAALTGQIPTELGLVTAMSSLVLHTNSFSGSIPSELGLITTLSELSLSDNTLMGRIPNELGKLESCYELDLSNNELTGVIPSELCYLGDSYGNDTKLIVFGNSNVTGIFLNETCVEVVNQPPVDWPGYFPPVNVTHDEVGINIVFDRYHNETEWRMEQGKVGECNLSSQTALGQWDLIESGVGKEHQAKEHIYVTKALLAETFYRFTLTDDFEDGLDGGWATITSGTSKTDNPDGSILWSLDVYAFTDVAVVHFWVDKEGHPVVVAEENEDNNSTHCMDDRVSSNSSSV